MTWSYALSTLAATPKDQVRLLIGDTDSAFPQLQDEEINQALAFLNSPWGAAAICCRSIAARVSRLADQTSGQSSVTYSQRAKAYAARALEYEKVMAERGGAVPYAGGISVSDMQSYQFDPDRVQPVFNIGMEDNTVPAPASGNEILDTGQLSGPE